MSGNGSPDNGIGPSPLEVSTRVERAHQCQTIAYKFVSATNALLPRDQKLEKNDLHELF